MINVEGEAHRTSVAGEDKLRISETFFKKKYEIGQETIGISVFLSWIYITTQSLAT